MMVRKFGKFLRSVFFVAYPGCGSFFAQLYKYERSTFGLSKISHAQ